MAQPDSAAILTAVARLVAESLSLSDVVTRLAAVLRDVIPFDRLHVLRLDRAESVVLYVARASGELEVTGHRIADAGSVAEPTDANVRSRIISTVQGARVHGALWLTVGRGGRLQRRTPGADGQRGGPAFRGAPSGQPPDDGNAQA